MKIQLKRSNVLASGAAKAPTAPQMEYGELAVNYNTADPVIFIKDSSGSVIRLTNDNTSINNEIVDINNKIDVIEGEISVIIESISAIEEDIAVLPDPLEGTAHQPGTLDMRYVSRFSWSDLPALV